MDLNRFWKFLGRYKWFLIIVPVIAAVVTSYLVRNLPQKYQSQTQISTGLIDKSMQVGDDGRNLDYFKVNAQFGNIMAMLQMQHIMSNLSYNLILHDLQYPEQAFRKDNEYLRKLSEGDRQVLIQKYHELMLGKEILTPLKDQEYPLYSIVEESGYDEDAVKKELEITHADNSDFVKVSFTSESPLLSAFLVNSLANTFIENYGLNVSNNQQRSILLLDSLLQDKQRVMNAKNAQLKDFKVANGVLNLDKQSEIIYGQITANEEARAQTLREIQSLQGAIAGIDRKLTDEGSAYSVSTSVAENSQLIAVRTQLQHANERYVDNGFKAADKNVVDSLQSRLSALVSMNSSRATANPSQARQGMFEEKMRMEVELDRAKNSMSSIESELAALRSRYAGMVPYDAGVQNYERDADVATQEYMDALNRYNQTTVESNIGMRLGIAQAGVPGPPEPSKKIVFVALSGVSSFSLCFAILFLIFITDRTIRNPAQLALATKSKVFTSVPKINESHSDLRYVWRNDQDNQTWDSYKGSMRSLRFEVDKLLSANTDKILGITSLYAQEGKSFIASSLAFAFALTERKVLLIGGDYGATKAKAMEEAELANDASGNSNTALQIMMTSNYSFESFLIKREIMAEDRITVLDKNEANVSLLEIQSAKSLASAFDLLRHEFDVIIIDSDSMEDLNRAKEWLLFADKTLAVYESGRSINEDGKEMVQALKEIDGFSGWVLNKTVPNLEKKPNKKKRSA